MPGVMDTDDDRKARLAAALRANLKKRKAQARGVPAAAERDPADENATGVPVAPLE